MAGRSHSSGIPPLKSASETAKAITTAPLLARNAVVNVVGQAAPTIVAILAIPPLLTRLGTARFGILTLVWVLIGYLGLFDLGMSRALTQVVSERIGEGDEASVASLVWTGVLLMLGLGLVATLGLSLGASVLVGSVLRVPLELRAETAAAFRLLSVAIPIVIITAAFFGVLSSFQRFGLLNAIRIPMAAAMFLAPLGVARWAGPTMTGIVAALLIVRIVSCLIHFAACLVIVPSLRTQFSITRAAARRLITFGSWMTVSNILSPLMSYMDRFFIGSVVAVSVVSYYASPYEVITRVGIVATAFAGVMYPAFATSFVSEREHAISLFAYSTKLLLVVGFCLTIPFAVFPPEGLRLWLGADFEAHSSVVLRWLAAGIMINGIAQIPFAFVQAARRPDVTAKLHLMEFPLYLGFLLFALRRWGYEGAAIAWTVRVFLDTLALFAMSELLARGCTKGMKRALLLFVISLILFGAGSMIASVEARALFLLIVLFLAPVAAFSLLLTETERARLVGAIRRWRTRRGR